MSEHGGNILVPHNEVFVNIDSENISLLSTEVLSASSTKVNTRYLLRKYFR